MINIAIYSLIGLTTLFGGLWYQNTANDNLGAFGDPFLSVQLASSPVSGYILETDGTDSSWVVNSGGGGSGSGFWSTTTDSLAMYDNTGDAVVIGGTATSSNWTDQELNVVGESLFTGTSTIEGGLWVGTTSPASYLTDSIIVGNDNRLDFYSDQLWTFANNHLGDRIRFYNATSSAKSAITWYDATSTTPVAVAAIVGHDFLDTAQTNEHKHVSIEVVDDTYTSLNSVFECKYGFAYGDADNGYCGVASGHNLRVGSGSDLLIVDSDIKLITPGTALDIYGNGQTTNGFRISTTTDNNSVVHTGLSGTGGSLVISDDLIIKGLASSTGMWVGSGGSFESINGTNDLYVWDDLEVDGTSFLGTGFVSEASSTVVGNFTITGTCTGCGGGSEWTDQGTYLEPTDSEGLFITSASSTFGSLLVGAAPAPIHTNAVNDLYVWDDLEIDGLSYLDEGFITNASSTVQGVLTLSGTTGDLIVGGGDITLGTTAIFSGGDTASLDNIDAINATTETTIEAAIDTLANLSSGGLADNTVLFTDVGHTLTLAGNPALATGQCFWSSTGIICEGTTDNTIEGLLTWPTITSSDKTITLPDLTGTVALLSNAQTFTGVKTLSANWVNTANPWADNEVADTLTIGASSVIANDLILEEDLKAVDTASDEECLTYEVTTGDFEWQSCGGGSGVWEQFNGVGIRTATAGDEVVIGATATTGPGFSPNEAVVLETNGSAYIAGELIIGDGSFDRIIGYNDSNTYFQFAEDQIQWYAGGQLSILAIEDATQDMVQVNSLQANVDFRVDHDNGSHLFLADAALNRVSVGTSSPYAKLTVWGDTDSTGARLFEVVTSASTTAMYIDDNGLLGCTLCLTAGTYGAATIDGDDINSNIAGRSLTLTSASPDTLDIDAEIYTETFSFMVASSTLGTTTSVMQHKLPGAITVTRVSCSTDVGTSTHQIDERAEATPNTSGTDILTAQIDCGSGHTNSTTSFSNAGITADNIINFATDKTDDQSSGATPTNIRFHVEYTIDD